MRAIVRSGRQVMLTQLARGSPGPNDVVVRIAFAGVCRTDLWAAEGKIPTVDPVILGHEASGTVETIGEAVTRVRIGDRVTIEPYAGSGRDRRMLGVDRDGVFADRICVPEAIVHVLPASLTLLTSAYVEPIAASLAVTRAPLPRPEDDPRGLVLGHGRIAVLTARVLRALGYHAIDVGADEIEPEAYAFAIETCATTETLRTAVRSVARGGVVVLKSRDRTPVGLSIGDVVTKEITLAGVEHGSFADAIALLASGELKLDDLMGDVMPLEAWETAFARARESEATKMVFRVDPEAR